MNKKFEFPELSIYELDAVDIVTTSMPKDGEDNGDNNVDWWGETRVN